MAFEVGDRVIYPNQGVGLVEAVFSSAVGGKEEQFYRLRLEASDSMVMVPVANADNIGVRRLCSEKDLKELFQVLDSDEVDTGRDWKNRYKDNVEKMMTGSIVEVAQVLKNLYYLSTQKPLSFREKKMHDRARQLVVSEIATVQKRDPSEVDAMLEERLAESCELVQPA